MPDPTRPCGASPLTGDLVCVLAHGHDGLHRNYQGIQYRSAADVEAADQSAERLPEAVPGRHRADVAAEVPETRFEGFGNTWQVRARRLLVKLSNLEQQAASQAEHVATLEQRLADEQREHRETQHVLGEQLHAHRTRAEGYAAAAAEWQERHDAVVEYNDLLEARINRALAILEGNDPDAGSELVDDDPDDRCPALLSVDHGDQGCEQRCILAVDHFNPQHIAREGSVEYRWSS